MKIGSIVLPVVDFKDASLSEGIEFFRQRSIEFDAIESDPEKKGINFVLLKSVSGQGAPDGRRRLQEETTKMRQKVNEARVMLLDIAEKYNIVEVDELADDEIYKSARVRLEEARRELDNKRNFVGARRDFDADELIQLLAAEGKPVTLAKLYQSYSETVAEIVLIKAREGDKSSKLRGPETQRKFLSEQLADEVGHYKNSLVSELQIEEKNFETAKTAIERLSADIMARRRMSIVYQQAKRDYDQKLEALVRLEEAVTDVPISPPERPATATLALKAVPLEVALKYFTQQIGATYAVQPHAVVIGSAEEIAGLE